jgi:hypothetical protein
MRMEQEMVGAGPGTALENLMEFQFQNNLVLEKQSRKGEK